MKDIKSLDQLNQFLDGELAWRKRELTTLKFMLEKPRRHEKSLLLRAAVCVLYAHWEGFVKAAAMGYVSFVATRGLRYRDLSANFVALGLRSEMSRAAESSKPTIHTALATQIRSGLSKLMNVDVEGSISTGSNLNASTLNEIVCLVGLDSKDYLPRGLLDQKLVGNRNLVAHGVRIDIDPAEHSRLHEEIIQLVQKFRTDMRTRQRQKTFAQVRPGLTQLAKRKRNEVEPAHDYAPNVRRLHRPGNVLGVPVAEGNEKSEKLAVRALDGYP